VGMASAVAKNTASIRPKALKSEKPTYEKN
jgi:hypothetical protein